MSHSTELLAVSSMAAGVLLCVSETATGVALGLSAAALGSLLLASHALATTVLGIGLWCVVAVVVRERLRARDSSP